MNLKFDVEILNLEGKPLVGPDQKPLTLKKAAVDALLALYPDEQTLSGEEKMKRYRIAKKITIGTEKDWTVEEIALVKKLIAKNYSSLLVGPAWELLEGNA